MTLSLSTSPFSYRSYLVPRSISNVERNNPDVLGLGSPIYFQFLPEITDNGLNANYNEFGTDVIGRAEQINVYSNSSNQSISLKATFIADGEISGFATGIDPSNATGPSKTVRDVYWVHNQVKRLQALTKPIYSRDSGRLTDNGKAYIPGILLPPPVCLFSYGVKFINTPVLVTSVTVEYDTSSLIDKDSLLPQKVVVSINLKTNYPYGYVPGYLDIARIYADVFKDGTNGLYSSAQSLKGLTQYGEGYDKVLVDLDTLEASILESEQV